MDPLILFITGEAPDSASDDGSEEESPPTEPPVLRAVGPSREEEVWEPTAEMLAEYEAAQTGKLPAIG